MEGRGLQGGDAQGVVLTGGEGGRGLDERRVVPERAQAPLLGQELLVRHGVDVVGEREGWTAGARERGREKGRQGR